MDASGATKCLSLSPRHSGEGGREGVRSKRRHYFLSTPHTHSSLPLSPSFLHSSVPLPFHFCLKQRKMKPCECRHYRHHHRYYYHHHHHPHCRRHRRHHHHHHWDPSKCRRDIARHFSPCCQRRLQSVIHDCLRIRMSPMSFIFWLVSLPTSPPPPPPPPPPYFLCFSCWCPEGFTDALRPRRLFLLISVSSPG